MRDHRKDFSLPFSIIKYVSLILCAPIATPAAAQEQDQSTVIYDTAYFEQFNPVPWGK